MDAFDLFLKIQKIKTKTKRILKILNFLLTTNTFETERLRAGVKTSPLDGSISDLLCKPKYIVTCEALVVDASKQLLIKLINKFFFQKFSEIIQFRIFGLPTLSK